MKKLRGVGVALVTPFNEDKTIDFNALARLIEYDINGGVSYLVVLGTTAESAVLTGEEKQQIADFVVKTNNGRVPLVIGIGGNNTMAVAKEMKNMNLNGYDAILSVVPYYNKPNQEGIYQHYKYLAGISPLPIIMYNVPGRTGVNMTAATAVRLAKEVKNIIAVKEASGNMGQIGYILRDRPEGFLVISGEDNISLSMIANGSDGVISVSANSFPKKFSRLVDLALNNDTAAAALLQNELIEATDLLFAEGNPTGVKAALAIKGLVKNELRLPLVKSSHQLYEALEVQIKKYNLE